MATTMDSKQLQDASKQIMKAAERGDPSETLIKLLQPLSKFSATEDLLRQSKIGVAVNKLRQSKDPKLSSLAGQLINKWKQDVRAKEKKGSSPAPGAKAAGVNGSSRVGTSSPAPGVKGESAKKGSGGEWKSKVALEKRTAKTDEVDTKVTGNPTRDGCIELIYNGLAFLSTEVPDDVMQVARTVELAAFDAHEGETSAAYKQKLRSLFMNLKMKENGELRRDVFSGKIEAKRFVNMTSDELKSQAKRESDALLEKENMSKAMTAQEEKAISTTYVFIFHYLPANPEERCSCQKRPHTRPRSLRRREVEYGVFFAFRRICHLNARPSANEDTFFHRMTCGKCRQSRVAYTQAQTRSADEPMTTFCECTNCGNRWKFS